MYLKFLYKHTIHINFPFKPNFLFISGFTAIIFIEIVKSTIRANLLYYVGILIHSNSQKGLNL